MDCFDGYYERLRSFGPGSTLKCLSLARTLHRVLVLCLIVQLQADRKIATILKVFCSLLIKIAPFLLGKMASPIRARDMMLVLIGAILHMFVYEVHLFILKLHLASTQLLFLLHS